MYLINAVILFSWLCTPALFEAGSPYREKQLATKVTPFSAQTTSPSQIERAPGQTRRPRPSASPKKDEEIVLAEALEAQRRTFAASIIMSLADEARSYKDPGLRARVLARSADALWDVDPDRARILLRRAWEAAEKADVAEDVGSSNSSAPAMVIALRRGGSGDSRAEVLSIAARRDNALGDEFLAKLNDTAAKTAEQSIAQTPRFVNDSWTISQEMSKRLSVAHWLLNDGKTEKAFEFAAPALDAVNEASINFLSRLRLLNPAIADKQFTRMLDRAELDPTSDANTVSGLSSYAFTPGMYLTFAGDGGIRWTPALEPIAAPNLPSEVRSSFFRVAASILLRPLPPPDQDLTSAGLIGKYMVIKRLLPLFEQYTPDIALALRSQLTALAKQGSDIVDYDDFLLTQGIARDTDSRTLLDRLLERVDRAKDQKERDEIYADAAAILAVEGNPAAQDIADKIDNVYRRESARRYVDISLLRTALVKKNSAAALRFAKADSLTHPQRAWAYLQVARLLKESDRTRALELLEEALAEALRIDANDPDRPVLISGVAIQFLASDIIRSWEVASEAVKAANAAEEFSGEAGSLNVALLTSSGLKLIDLDISTLNLSVLVSSLAKQDHTRAGDVAKSFRYEAPRAIAILAVASATMAKATRAK